MMPRRISGANVELKPPLGWDEAKQGKCVSLWVRRAPWGDCESAWEPTPAELEALNRGASIVLRVFGGQPAVALYVGDAGDPRQMVEGDL
jgi:hypothetical protein